MPYWVNQLEFARFYCFYVVRDKSNEVCMTEILAKVLRDAHIPFDFDLAALLQDRSERNGMTHALDLIMLYRAHQATAVGVSIIVDD